MIALWKPAAALGATATAALWAAFASAPLHAKVDLKTAFEALDTNPKLSAKFQRILRRMRYFLADVIRRGQAEGTVRPDVDPEQTAALVAATIMGAEIQHYQDPGEVDLRRVLDTLVAQLGDWLMPRTHLVAKAGGITA